MSDPIHTERRPELVRGVFFTRPWGAVDFLVYHKAADGTQDVFLSSLWVTDKMQRAYKAWCESLGIPVEERGVPVPANVGPAPVAPDPSLL